MIKSKKFKKSLNKNKQTFKIFNKNKQTFKIFNKNKQTFKKGGASGKNDGGAPAKSETNTDYGNLAVQCLNQHCINSLKLNTPTNNLDLIDSYKSKLVLLNELQIILGSIDFFNVKEFINNFIKFTYNKKDEPNKIIIDYIIDIINKFVPDQSNIISSLSSKTSYNSQKIDDLIIDESWGSLFYIYFIKQSYKSKFDEINKTLKTLNNTEKYSVIYRMLKQQFDDFFKSQNSVSDLKKLISKLNKFEQKINEQKFKHYFFKGVKESQLKKTLKDEILRITEEITSYNPIKKNKLISLFKPTLLKYNKKMLDNIKITEKDIEELNKKYIEVSAEVKTTENNPKSKKKKKKKKKKNLILKLQL